MILCVSYLFTFQDYQDCLLGIEGTPSDPWSMIWQPPDATATDVDIGLLILAQYNQLLV
jgi:hypothetical protein